MRAVVQRVSQASVTVGGRPGGTIAAGLLVYLGVARDDDEGDITYIVDKVRHLRIFPDEDGRMNLNVVQVAGAVLVVSAFTVQADARRGRRPALEAAETPERAAALYERFCTSLAGEGVPVSRGVFGADMDVASVNTGPVCILLDSRHVF